MCNLYSMTKNADAIRRLFAALNSRVGNLPSMPGIFPDYPAPIVRNAPDGREIAMAGRSTAMSVRNRRGGICSSAMIPAPSFRGQLPMAAHGPHRPVCERGRLLAHPSRLAGSRRNRLCKIKRAGRAAADRHLRADQTPLSVMVHDPRFLIRSFTCCVVIICPGKYSSLPVTSSTI
jgi:hypothetical protein